MSSPAPTCLLLLAAGAAWEEIALRVIGPGTGVVVVKRCIDLHDLLASATSRQADVAVVAASAEGLDHGAVDHLHRAGVAVVVVAEHARENTVEHGRRAGVDLVLDETQVSDLPDRVRGLRSATGSDDLDAMPTGPVRSRGTAPAVAVWGPTGAPGRTTVALGVAGALAARGQDPLLLDLDPYAGTVAQHLGVLDDVSGLLASSRRLVAGDLTSAFVALQRRGAGMRLLTGLPRADRWTELTHGLAEELLQLGRRQGPVVADLGWCLEEDRAAVHTGRPGRHDLTRDAVAAADVVLVVGTADPIGLTRLVRALAELREQTVVTTPHVVVNRMRRSLGWEPGQVADLLGRCGPLHGISFLPDDRGTLDRAMVAGRGITELGESDLSRGFDALVDAALPGIPAGVKRRRLLRR
ncbi:hypothetical protein [Nocardioides alcanivorans]|uniref:hypothetical protein n=1 Tax=Nocardioides alcanivorans TaxID=2897352 RepID=UPI001F47BCB6|nr:hypothetical protein [Nocardioides alcanivorans]